VAGRRVQQLLHQRQRALRQAQRAAGQPRVEQRLGAGCIQLQRVLVALQAAGSKPVRLSPM
jgi:hypothetical protein